MSKSRQNVTSRTQTRNYPQPGRGPPVPKDDRRYHLPLNGLRRSRVSSMVRRYHAATPSATLDPSLHSHGLR